MVREKELMPVLTWVTVLEIISFSITRTVSSWENWLIPKAISYLRCVSTPSLNLTNNYSFGMSTYPGRTSPINLL